MYRIVVQPQAVESAPSGARLSHQVTVRLVGEIDALATEHLALVLGDAHSARPRTLIVDLSEATFLNCSSLLVLQHALLTAQGRGTGFRIIGATGGVRRLLVWAQMGPALEPAAQRAPRRARLPA